MDKKLTNKQCKQWIDVKMFLCEAFDPQALDNELWISLLDGFLLGVLLKTKKE